MKKCIYVQLVVYIKLCRERRNKNTVHKSTETDWKNAFTFAEDQKRTELNLRYKNARASKGYTLPSFSSQMSLF